MTKLSDECKEKLKLQLRDLMIVTMDYCIESKETQQKAAELLGIIGQDIGRPLTETEIFKINEAHAAYAQSLVCPHDPLNKELNYSNVFNYIEAVTNNG
jgi:hypothetical protein